MQYMRIPSKPDMDDENLWEILENRSISEKRDQNISGKRLMEVLWWLKKCMVSKNILKSGMQALSMLKSAKNPLKASCNRPYISWMWNSTMSSAGVKLIYGTLIAKCTSKMKQMQYVWIVWWKKTKTWSAHQSSQEAENVNDYTSR